MKTCLYTGILEDRDVYKAIDFTAEQGFEAIEIGGTYDCHFNPDKITIDEAQHIIDYAKNKGLEVADIAQHVLFAVKDPKEFRRRVDYFKKNIYYASRIGVPMIVTCTGGTWDWVGNLTGIDGLEAFNRVVEGLKESARYAEEVGVTIALEAVFENVVTTYVDMCRVLDTVDSPNLKINFDVQQYAVQLFDIPKLIHSYGDLICHCHLKGVTVKPPSGHVVDQFIYPPMGGQGDDINWMEFIEALKNINYKGALSLNYESKTLPLTPGWTRESIVKECLRFLKSVLKK